MKKTTSILSSATLLAAALSSVSATAYTGDVMDSAQDPAQGNGSQVETRQVDYTCQNDAQVSVTYAFDEQELPTYAQVTVNGENEFLPLDPSRSNDVDTVFGNAEGFSLVSGALNLSNYDQSSINIQNANGEVVYSGCQAASAD